MPRLSTCICVCIRVPSQYSEKEFLLNETSTRERERKKLSTQVKTTNKYNIHTLVCPVMKEETARNELLSIYGDAERMRVCQYKLFLRLRFSSSFKFLIVAVVVTFPYFSFWVFSRALLSDSCWLPPKVLLLARSLLFSVSTLDVILYCD